MSDDVLLVQCPDCASTLKVDARTGAVLSHAPPASRKKLSSFEDAAKEMARQKERAEDLFSATVEREKKKSEILEKTFREALTRAQADPSRPRNPMDDD